MRWLHRLWDAVSTPEPHHGKGFTSRETIRGKAPFQVGVSYIPTEPLWMAAPKLRSAGTSDLSRTWCSGLLEQLPWPLRFSFALQTWASSCTDGGKPAFILGSFTQDWQSRAFRTETPVHSERGCCSPEAGLPGSHPGLCPWGHRHGQDLSLRATWPGGQPPPSTDWSPRPENPPCSSSLSFLHWFRPGAPDDLGLAGRTAR